MKAGARLKEVRNKLGISTREVARFSKAIADAEGKPEFFVSGAWVTQIENGDSTLPSIYKLFTLASVYGLSYTGVLALYGIDVTKVGAFHAAFPIPQARLPELDSISQQVSEIRIRSDPVLNLNHTNLLAKMIETWGETPLRFIEKLDIRHRPYGFIGFDDYTLYPLLRPGSFVEIDPDFKTVLQQAARSEFDRPIYFVDLRKEYACSWCEIRKDKLLLLSHPLSRVKTRILAYPAQAEIIGRVTRVAMKISISLSNLSDEIPRAGSSVQGPT
jgi:transcriptional regulator with XRE-family HTH domain